MDFLIHIWWTAFAFQVFYYGIWLLRFDFFKPKKTLSGRTVQKPVSVVIAAKNEARNFKKHLLAVLEQDYPEFEVIVVNDASQDDSISVLEKMQLAHDRLKIIDIPATEKYRGNKKNALSRGIEQAQYDYLLFTDADCEPAGKNWITEMTAGLHTGSDAVLGYSPYRREKAFLHSVLGYDTFLTAWQYFSYALWGVPYMGVGRNMAYTKEFFYGEGGFSSHRHIRSGDDDLLINERMHGHKISICTAREAHVLSDSPMSWWEWFAQKRRHITTSYHYTFLHKAMLAAFFLSEVFFLTGWIGLISGFSAVVLLSAMLLRYLLKYLSGQPASMRLREGKMWILFPVWEVIWVLFQMLIFVSDLVRPKKNW